METVAAAVDKTTEAEEKEAIEIRIPKFVVFLQKYPLDKYRARFQIHVEPGATNRINYYRTYLGQLDPNN